MKTQVSFLVRGKVQGVMFRKTFVNGAMKRNLEAGATNSLLRRDEVHCTLLGESAQIKEIKEALMGPEKLNSWGARVEEIVEIEFLPLSHHEVTSTDFQECQLPTGISFFL